MLGAVVSGVIAAAVTTVIVRGFSSRVGEARAAADGRLHLAVPGFVTGVIVFAAALAGLILWHLATGGSARPDAARQNLYAALLALAFAGMAALLAWQAFGRRIRVQGEVVSVHASGRVTVYDLRAATDVTLNALTHTYRVTFQDGSALHFSEYLHGSGELAARAVRRASARRPGVGRGHLNTMGEPE